MLTHRTKHGTTCILYLGLTAAVLVASVRAEDAFRYLFFDGKDDYVSGPFVPFEGSFTIEAWYLNWSHYLCSQGAAGDPENSVWLSTSGGVADGCGWEDNQEESGVNFAQDVGMPQPGKWTHLAMVFDGGTQRVFLHGKLVGEQECAAPGELDRARGFVIGAEPIGDDNSSWNFGSGFLRSFRISSCARYTSDFVPATSFEGDDNTVLLFTHTAVDGDTLLDQSGKKSHAKIHGVRLLSPESVSTRLLKGKAIGPDGKPAENVYVFLQQNEKAKAATKTDSSGQYCFLLNNPKGKYSMEAANWHRVAPGRWTTTMEGEVEGITVNESPIDLELTSTPQDPLNELAFLVGEWESIAPDGSREKVTFEWINNSNFILATIGETKEIIGLDLETKQLTSWAFGSGGGYGRMQWTKFEDGWRVEATPHWWFAGGETGKWWRTMKVVSEDEVHVEGGMVSGGEEQKWSVVSRRKQ